MTAAYPSNTTLHSGITRFIPKHTTAGGVARDTAASRPNATRSKLDLRNVLVDGPLPRE